jgi:hypothetical protein
MKLPPVAILPPPRCAISSCKLVGTINDSERGIRAAIFIVDDVERGACGSLPSYEGVGLPEPVEKSCQKPLSWRADQFVGLRAKVIDAQEFIRGKRMCTLCLAASSLTISCTPRTPNRMGWLLSPATVSCNSMVLSSIVLYSSVGLQSFYSF